MEKYYLIVKSDDEITLRSEVPFKMSRKDLKDWNVYEEAYGFSVIEGIRKRYREFWQLPLEKQVKNAERFKAPLHKFYEEDFFKAYPSDKSLLRAFKKAGYTTFLNRDRYHDIVNQIVKALYTKFEEWKETKVLLPYDPKEVKMHKNWMTARKDIPIMVIDETGTLVYCVGVRYTCCLFQGYFSYGWDDVLRSVLYMPIIHIGADGSYVVSTEYCYRSRRTYGKIATELNTLTDDIEAYDKWLGDLRKILV